MGSIYLIRHGQASFGKEDYDELSKKGHKQSGVLGEYLNRYFANTSLGNSTQTDVDFVVTGSMKRHKQTADGCLGALNGSFDIHEQAGFNEFDHLDVIHQHKPAWIDRGEMAKELASYPHPLKRFELIFSKAIKRWIAGEHDHEYQESWLSFKQRIESAFQELVSSLPPSKNVLVFTSGGPIAVICGMLLGLDERGIFSINQNLANTGITRVLYSADRLSLSYLNNFAHLEHKEHGLLTYR